MHPIRIDQLTAAQHAELDHANRTAKDDRLRIRALIVLLAAERGTWWPRRSPPWSGCTSTPSGAGSCGTRPRA
jgi:hypothetical protein